MGKNQSLWTLFIVTELYLLANMPYMFTAIMPLPSIYVSSALYVLIVTLFLLSGKHAESLPGKFNMTFFITILAWGMFGVIHDDSSYYTRILFLLITYTLITALYNRALFFKFWQYNNYFILIQAVLSVIGFLMVGLGLLHPLVSTYYNNIVPVNYFGLCFSKTLMGNLIRPSGFFDEPGALAGWAIYSLMFNYAFIKDKYVSKYLPYLTTVTLSIAYFIQIAIFLLLSSIKRIYRLIPVALLVIIGIYYINKTQGSDFDVYEKTFARLEYSSETVIEGNSRQIRMDNAKAIFKQSPIVGVGGRVIGEMDLETSDNPYEILAKDGIIGYIISYLPLIGILFCNRRKEVLLGVLVIAVGYLQRPLHINFIHDLYIWSFLLFALIDSKSKSSKLSKPNYYSI